MAEPRMSTPDEIEALDDVCRQMAGFEEAVSVEWLDGYMTALAAGPRRISHDEWLPRMAEGVFARTFGDPDRWPKPPAQAMDAALAGPGLEQLEPEELVEHEDVMRLAPLMIELTDEDKQRLVAEGHIKPEELDLLEPTGEVWAYGFMEATRDFPADWPEPDVETEDGQFYDECLMRVISLTLNAEELKEMADELYEGEELTRDELMHEALYATQDLRVYWLDHQPKAPPRRVGELPGRNDACPCGSGKKFKKCHGAQMQ
ncbi:MAG: UPF0149 family protein [Ideonella sp.]|nr:UPF0149 family protein [Ideonella sp.]